MIRFPDYSKHVYTYDAKGKKLRAEYHTPIQPYKYNGKELDRHHGLDWYDYGARWDVLTNIFNQTSTTEVKEKRGYQKYNPFSYLTLYGRLVVIGGD